MRTPDPEVHQVAEALRDAIRKAKTSQRAVERALGQSQGYLSQILNGSVDLKLKHVFEVLNVIGAEPADFFSNVYGCGGAATLELMAHLSVAEQLVELKLRIANLERVDAMARRRA